MLVLKFLKFLYISRTESVNNTEIKRLFEK